MLSCLPLVYYKQILKHYEYSYFAEDEHKVIIGIDPLFLDAKDMDLSELKFEFYQESAKKPLCEYAGFFGVLAADFYTFFEKIDTPGLKNYDFPLFLFANARAYLVYEKHSKLYFEYGDSKYFDFLKDEKNQDEPCDFEFKIENDLEAEKADFMMMIKKAKEYLASGDIFQVVLSKQLCIQSNVDSLSFYSELAKQNPSPYMFHFPTPYGVVVGSSPELVLSIKNKEIFIAPIAGTRNLNETSDRKALAKDLLSDEKELCEHRMLVDLARNDISRFGTKTRVENVFELVSYQYVMHIVSSVYAFLKDEASIFDAIGAIFPAGTLSGAPKIRALELIADLEGLNRGVYGGAIGFLNFNENVCLAIIIRSAFFTQNKAFIASGAGIVMKSEAEKEYAEIKAKRQSLIKSFEALRDK